MPVLKKLTEAEFNATACTDRKNVPTVKVYAGDVLVKLNFDKYDLEIPAGTYKTLVFIPCELLSEINWVRVFNAEKITNLAGDRIARKIPGTYKIIELENRGVLFAFN